MSFPCLVKRFASVYPVTLSRTRGVNGPTSELMVVSSTRIRSERDDLLHGSLSSESLTTVLW